MAHNVQPFSRYAVVDLQIAVCIDGATPGFEEAHVCDAINERFNGDLAEGTELAADWAITHVHEPVYAGLDTGEGDLIHAAQYLIQSEENALRDRLVTALRHYAEDPADKRFDDATCHRGITTRDNCVRCSRAMEAWRLMNHFQEN